MFFLVPLFCGLAVAERAVNYYNARKAKKSSRRLYKETKEYADRNIRFKKKRNRKVRSWIEDLDGYGEEW